MPAEPIRLSEAFGRQVMETRKRKGWSQERLSEEMTVLGMQLHGTAITKLERGDRKVSVDEALALAEALGVSPLHLLVPRDNQTEVRVAPALDVSTAEEVRAWLRGNRPLWSRDKDHAADVFYFKEQPDEDWWIHKSDLYRQVALLEVTARAIAAEGPQNMFEPGRWSDLVECLGELNETVERIQRLAKEATNGEH